MSAIMGLVVAIFLITIYASAKTAIKPGAPLGVHLPAEAARNGEVEDIVKQYQKVNLLLLGIFLIAAVPIFFISTYPSVLLLYLFAWIGAILYEVSHIMARYHQKLLTLKRKNHWVTASASKLITIDTEVTRLKDTMPISRAWFLIPLLLGLAPFVMAMTDEAYRTLLLSFGASSLVGTVIFYWLYTLVSRERTVIYSENTEVNLACNTVRKRTLSFCWLLVAILETASMIVFSLGVRSTGGLAWLWMPLNCILVVFVVIASYRRVNAEQRRLAEVEKEPYYADDNDAWTGGLFYNNPYDSRTMVEKRIGYGYTFNLATKKGKVIAYSTLIGIVALVAFLFVSLFQMDFGKIEMAAANGTVEIKAPMYGYQFDAKDIQSIALLDTIPGGARTNGAATDRYLLGNFDLKGYGKSKVFVQLENPPFIVIELEGLHVFLNGYTPEQTRQYYEQLQELQAKSSQPEGK